MGTAGRGGAVQTTDSAVPGWRASHVWGSGGQGDAPFGAVYNTLGRTPVDLGAGGKTGGTFREAFVASGSGEKAADVFETVCNACCSGGRVLAAFGRVGHATGGGGETLIEFGTVFNACCSGGRVVAVSGKV